MPFWQNRNGKTQLLCNSVTKLFPSFEKRITETLSLKMKYWRLSELYCRKGGEFPPGQITCQNYWYN